MRSFTVRVVLDFIDRLNGAIADPRNKADEELGGILLGRIVEPELVEVDGFEFIQSDHHRGTIFGLGIRERDRASRRVGALHKHSGAVPVGFFRTHLRPGLYLDQDDFALMTEAFSDPSQIALLLRPVAPGPSNAGIFLWEEGDMDRRQTLQLFPFDSDTLRLQGPVEVSAAPPLNRPTSESSATVSRGIPGIPRAVLAWSLAGLASVALAAIALEHRPRTVSAVVDHPLDLKLRRQGQALVVDWNKKASVVQQAASAVLTIDDGGSTQKLNLGRTDLQRGAVQFWPRTNDVSVKMDLTKRYVVGTPHVRQPSPAPVRAQEPPPPTASVSKAAIGPVRLTKPQAEPPPRPVEAVKPRQFVLPIPRAEPPAAKTIAASLPPPVIQPAAIAEPISPTDLPKPSLSSLPPPPHDRSVAVSVSVEPKSSEIRKVVSHVPLLGRPFHPEGGSNFSPPRPSRPLEPSLPQSLAENLWKEMAVDVHVSLDKNGAVRTAEVVGGRKSQLADLAAGAVESASWEPAREGARAIPSDIVVHYRFTPRN